MITPPAHRWSVIPHSGIQPGLRYLPGFLLDDEDGGLLRPDAFSGVEGIDLGEFSAEIKDQGRVVYPGEYEHNGRCRAVGDAQVRLAEVKSDQKLAKEKKGGRKGGADEGVPPGD